MRLVRFILWMPYLLASVGGASPLLLDSKAIHFQLVNTLDQSEPWTDSQVFHSGLFWSGRSVVNFQNESHVEVYSPADSKMLASVQLPHNIQAIRPYGPNSVIALGVTAEPYWVSYYSIVKYDSSSKALTAETRYFPIGYGADYYVGDYNRGLKYFTDVGNGGMFIADSNQDTAVTIPFTGSIPSDPDSAFPVNSNPPWRTPRHPHEPGDVSDLPGIEVPFDSPNFLAPRLHGPGHAVMVGDWAFVVEDLDGSGMDSDIARVDVKNETISRPFSSKRAGLINLTNIPGTDWVIAAEKGTNKILFVDAKSNQLKQEIQLSGKAGDVWDVTPFGHCVAVLSTLSTKVTFFDVLQTPARNVAEWDLSAYIDRFHRARAVSGILPAAVSMFVQMRRVPRATARPRSMTHASFRTLPVARSNFAPNEKWRDLREEVILVKRVPVALEERSGTPSYLPLYPN